MFNLTNQQATVLTALFSATNLKNMADNNTLGMFATLLREARVTAEQIKGITKIEQVYEAVFKALALPGMRNEYVYKSALAHKLLLGVHSLNTATMLSEFRTGASKADVVILNGTSTVYEIKSERDSLSRLKTQLDDYQKTFARVNVITSEKQVDSVLASIPKKVGVLCLTRRYQISTIRAAVNQPELVCPITIFKSLRRNEASTILENLGITLPDVPNTKIYSEMLKLFAQQDSTQIHSEMVKVLKQTRSQAKLNSFISRLPKSLQAAGLTLELNNKQQQGLLASLNKPFLL